MANLAFMTGKYIFEAALLNFFLAWGLLKRPAAAARTAARFWWLFLTSGLLQGLAYYLVNRYFTETTFTLRYVLMNGLTMLLFWRIALRQPWQLSLFLLSHVLITMQFCQILATYVIYTFEHHIVVVTEFAIREQLISESIILLLFAAISLFSVRQSRDITNMLPASAGRCCLFLWCFYAIGRLLNQFFVKAQVYPAVTVLLYFLFLVELAVFFTITMQMVRLRVASAEKARMAQQYALQLQHADELSSLYLDFRKLRHEAKNQAIYVRHLLRTKNYAALDAYYAQYETAADELTNRLDSGNQLVNAILWSKAKSAEREGIPIVLEAALPPELPVEGSHLCSLLVNLLDNALEASAHVRQPEIRVCLRMKQNHLFCCVMNRVDSDVLAANPELKTTKRDRALHGFGIRSIRLITEEYHGMSDFTVDHGFFTATVMLPCSAAQEARR